MARKYTPKKACPMGRWRAGEVGVAQKNDSQKYDVKLYFGTIEAELYGKPITVQRTYYFYFCEVEKVREAVRTNRRGKAR